jgi:hypothetical protein
LASNKHKSETTGSLVFGSYNRFFGVMKWPAYATISSELFTKSKMMQAKQSSSTVATTAAYLKNCWIGTTAFCLIFSA